MNTTTTSPALVTRRAAQRLPRLALLLFCAAYLLPGLFGRDPWKSADLSAFGVMASIAEGRSSWLAPTLGGVPFDGVLLPHWLGAAAIRLLSPLVDAPLAARIPFALLLALTLVLTWYSTFHLARTEAAQPVPFAFGGEANAVDYARAMADGTVLALIATLGALQLGHETTPELAQLFSTALALWALAAAPFRDARARLAVLLGLPLLAASGAPAMACGVGLAGAVVCARSSFANVRVFARWVAAATALAVIAGLVLQTWAWRLETGWTAQQVLRALRMLLWFLWPAWLLALWTVWRWRGHLLHRHIAVPLSVVAVATLSSLAMGGSDRALMLGLPGFAVLAAFALPTLQRGTSAAVDWFSVFFFSACAVGGWVIYAAMQWGWPAKTAANIAKLAPGFRPQFSAFALLCAALGSIAWLWLVRWRTKRHQHAMWKSLLLPAGGVALCWLLAMTLWLPLMDYALSYRPWTDRLAPLVPRGSCVATQGLDKAHVAALEHFGRWRVDAQAQAADKSACDLLLIAETRTQRSTAPPGWTFVSRTGRPTSRDESTALYRRTP